MTVDLDQVRSFLQSRLKCEIETIEALHGGEWSHAFGFRAEEQQLVARFGNHIDDFERDQAASTLSCTDMPIPAVLEIGDAFEGHFCISERMYGETLEELDRDRMTRTVPAILRLLDALRLADTDKWISQVGGPTVDWRNSLMLVDEETDRVSGWHDRMDRSPTGKLPFERALAWLRPRVPSCPNVMHLTHNDLLHYNVLVKEDRISAVFDWGCAALGDFLYDLALFTFYAPWFPSTAHIDWLGEAKRHFVKIGLEVPEISERMRCYEVHHGLVGMAFCAFVCDDQELAAHAKRTLEVMSLA